MESMFDRTERGLGSTSLSVPDIVAKTRGNPQQILQMVMGGQINVTQGLLAKRMSDAVISERAKMQAASPTVLQEAFPEMAPQQGGLAGAPQVPPQSVPSSPATEGGLGAAPIPEQMFQGGGQGGVASFAEGDSVMPDYLTPKEVSMEDMMGMIPQRETGAFDAYKAAVGDPIDQNKARERDQMLAVLGSIGQVQPGTNPLQAFMQSMGGTAKSMAASEKDRKAQTMAQFKALAELEGKQNEFTQQDFNMAYQLKQAKEGRLDKKDEMALQKALAEASDAQQMRIAQLQAATQIKTTGMTNATSAANSRRSAAAQRAGNTSADRATMAAVVKQAGDVVDRAAEEVENTREGKNLKATNFPEYQKQVAANAKRYAAAYAGFPELQNQIMAAAKVLAAPKASKKPTTTKPASFNGFSAKPM